MNKIKLFVKRIIRPLIILIAALAFCGAANATGAWTQKANFSGNAKYGVVGFSIGTKGYIGTGNDSAGLSTNFFWEWDQGSNTWTQKANFPSTARFFAAGFSIGNKGYIGTGYDNFYRKDFWEWDQGTNTWSQKLNFSPRNGAVGFSIGTKGYFGNGQDSLVIKNDFWEWDQATDVWTQKANLTVGRYNSVGFSIGTKGYIGTGSDVTAVRKDFWEWDQGTNVWTQKANFGGVARDGAIGFSIGTKGYIGMGEDINTIYKKDFWEWDQATNIWTPKANCGGLVRWSPVGFSIGSMGYVGIGASGFNPFTYARDFWEYDPSAVGIDEINFSNSFSIFPNPSSGKFQISSSTYKLTSVEIYTVLGEKIYQSSVSHSPSGDERFAVDISAQASGVYFVCVRSENGMATKKIIKE